MTNDPFVSPTILKRRIKVFIWGEYGSGKTPLALTFPAPVLFDLEDGGRFYGQDTPLFKKVDFKVFPGMPTLAEFYTSIEWLEQNEHPYKTIIIDPITVFYRALINKWTAIFHRQQAGKAGDKKEFYRLQGNDWPYVHEEYRVFVNRLLRLDMNVVCTAHQKTKYKKGEMLVYDGETFDCGRDTPYLFDTIIRMYKDHAGNRKGVCERDRSGHIPEGEVFQCDYKTFKEFFGKESLEKEATPIG